MAGWLTDEQLRGIKAYATSGDDRELLTLVAEVPHARNVIEASRMLGEALRSGSSFFTELARLLVAIEAYDQAGSGS
jgi:hypothetical protein